MSIKVAILSLLLPFSVWASAEYPNEPAGSTPYFRCTFNDGNICGMGDRYNSTAGWFTSPGGGNQLSPGGVIDEFKAAGSGSGNWQIGLDFQKQREIFMGFVWRTTAMGLSNNNNKIIFIKNPSNSFIVWQGMPGTNAKQLKWYQQERVDNCHISGYGPYCWNKDGDGTGWFPPNVNGSVAMVAPGDPFVKVEIYLKGSTTNTSKDGIIRIWINGVLSTNYTNVNHGTDLADFPGGFRNVEITSTWDGSFSTPEAWHHYFDDLIVSFPNGGGTVVVPQPATLNKPTNLRFI